MASRSQRYYNQARTVYRTVTKTRRARRGGFGIAMNGQFLIGAAASFIPVSLPPIANTAVAAVAVAPIRLPGGMKMMAQGYMMGKIVQQFIGNPIAGLSGNNTTSGGWY